MKKKNKIDWNKLRTLFMILLLIATPVISADEMNLGGTLTTASAQDTKESKLNEIEEEPEILENSLLIYNVSSLEPRLLYSIPVGSNPRHLVSSPDERYLYITNAKSNTVTVFDRASLSSSGSVETGKWPEDIDISPDGKFLLVANMDPKGEELYGHLTYIDTTNLSTRKIPLNAPASSVSITPDGKDAFYTIFKNNEIGRVSLAEMKPVSDTKLGTGPIHIKAVKDGKELILTTYLSNEVWVPKYDLLKTRLMKNHPGNGPHDIAVNFDESKFLVTDFNLGTVAQINFDNLTTDFVYTSGERRAIDAIYNPVLVNDTSVAYVTTMSDGYVKVINLSNGEEVASKKSGKYLHGQEISKDGQFLFVLNGESESEDEAEPEEMPEEMPGEEPTSAREMEDIGIVARVAHSRTDTIPKDDLPWIFTTPYIPESYPYSAPPGEPDGLGGGGSDGGDGAPKQELKDDVPLPLEELPSGDEEQDKEYLEELTGKFNLYPIMGTLFAGEDVKTRSDLLVGLGGRDYFYLTSFESYIGRALGPFEKEVLRSYFETETNTDETDKTSSITGAVVSDTVSKVMETLEEETEQQYIENIKETDSESFATFEDKFEPEEEYVEDIKGTDTANFATSEDEKSEIKEDVFETQENEEEKIILETDQKQSEEKTEEVLLEESKDAILQESEAEEVLKQTQTQYIPSCEPLTCYGGSVPVIHDKSNGCGQAGCKELGEDAFICGLLVECSEGQNMVYEFDKLTDCYTPVCSDSNLQTSDSEATEEQENIIHRKPNELLKSVYEQVQSGGGTTQREGGCITPYRKPVCPVPEAQELLAKINNPEITNEEKKQLGNKINNLDETLEKECKEKGGVLGGAFNALESCYSQKSCIKTTLNEGELCSTIELEDLECPEDTIKGQIYDKLNGCWLPDCVYTEPVPLDSVIPNENTIEEGLTQIEQLEYARKAMARGQLSALSDPEIKPKLPELPEGTEICKGIEMPEERDPCPGIGNWPVWILKPGEGDDCTGGEFCMEWSCVKDLKEQAGSSAEASQIENLAAQAAISDCGSSVGAMVQSASQGTISQNVMCVVPKKAKQEEFEELKMDMSDLGRYGMLQSQLLSEFIGRAQLYYGNIEKKGYAYVMLVWAGGKVVKKDADGNIVLDKKGRPVMKEVKGNIDNRDKNTPHMKAHDDIIFAISNNIFRPKELADGKSGKDCKKGIESAKDIVKKIKDFTAANPNCVDLAQRNQIRDLDAVVSKDALGRLNENDINGLIGFANKIDSAVNDAFRSQLVNAGDDAAIDNLISALGALSESDAVNSVQRDKDGKLSDVSQFNEQLAGSAANRGLIQDLDLGKTPTEKSSQTDAEIVQARKDFINDCVNKLEGWKESKTPGECENELNELKDLLKKLKDALAACEEKKEDKDDPKKGKSQQDSILGHILGLMDKHNDLVKQVFEGDEKSPGLLPALSQAVTLYSQYQFFQESARNMGNYYGIKSSVTSQTKATKSGGGSSSTRSGGSSSSSTETSEEVCSAEEEIENLDTDQTEENFFTSLKDALQGASSELGGDLSQEQIESIIQGVREEPLFDFYSAASNRFGSDEDIMEAVNSMSSEELSEFLNSVDESMMIEEETENEEETETGSAASRSSAQGSGTKGGLSSLEGVDPDLKQYVEMTARAAKTRKTLEDLIKKIKEKVNALPIKSFEEELTADATQRLISAGYISRLSSDTLLCWGLPCSKEFVYPWGHVQPPKTADKQIKVPVNPGAQGVTVADNPSPTALSFLDITGRQTAEVENSETKAEIIPTPESARKKSDTASTDSFGEGGYFDVSGSIKKAEEMQDSVFMDEDNDAEKDGKQKDEACDPGQPEKDVIKLAKAEDAATRPLWIYLLHSFANIKLKLGSFEKMNVESGAVSRGDFESAVRQVMSGVADLLSISRKLAVLWGHELVIATAAIAQESNNYDQDGENYLISSGLSGEGCVQQTTEVDAIGINIYNQMMQQSSSPTYEGGKKPTGAVITALEKEQIAEQKEIEEEKGLGLITGMQTAVPKSIEIKTKEDCEAYCEDVVDAKKEKEEDDKGSAGRAYAKNIATVKKTPSGSAPNIAGMQGFVQSFEASTGQNYNYYDPRKPSNDKTDEGIKKQENPENVKELIKNNWVSQAGIKYNEEEEQTTENCKKKGITDARDSTQFVMTDDCLVVSKKRYDEYKYAEGKPFSKDDVVAALNRDSDLCKAYKNEFKGEYAAKFDEYRNFMLKASLNCQQFKGYTYNGRPVRTHQGGSLADEDGCIVDALTGKIWSKETGKLTDKPKNCKGGSCCETISKDALDNHKKLTEQLNKLEHKKQIEEKDKELSEKVEGKDGKGLTAKEVQEKLIEIKGKQKDEVKNIKDAIDKRKKLSENKKEQLEYELKQKLAEKYKDYDDEMIDVLFDKIKKDKGEGTEDDIKKLIKDILKEEEIIAGFDALLKDEFKLNELASENIQIQKLKLLIESGVLTEKDARDQGLLKEGQTLNDLVQKADNFLNRFKNMDQIEQNKQTLERAKGLIEKQSKDLGFTQKIDDESIIKVERDKLETQQKEYEEYQKNYDEFKTLSNKKEKDLSKVEEDRLKELNYIKEYEELSKIDEKTLTKEQKDRLNELKRQIPEFSEEDIQRLQEIEGMSAEVYNVERAMKQWLESHGVKEEKDLKEDAKERYDQLKNLKQNLLFKEYLEQQNERLSNTFGEVNDDVLGRNFEAISNLNTLGETSLFALAGDKILTPPDFLLEEYKQTKGTKIALSETFQNLQAKSTEYQKERDEATKSGLVLDSKSLNKLVEMSGKNEKISKDGSLQILAAGFVKKGALVYKRDSVTGEYILATQSDIDNTKNKLDGQIAEAYKNKDKAILGKDKEAIQEQIDVLKTQLDQLNDKNVIPEFIEFGEDKEQQLVKLKWAFEQRKNVLEKFQNENQQNFDNINKFGLTTEDRKRQAEALDNLNNKINGLWNGFVKDIDLPNSFDILKSLGRSIDQSSTLSNLRNLRGRDDLTEKEEGYIRRFADVYRDQQNDLEIEIGYRNKMRDTLNKAVPEQMKDFLIALKQIQTNLEKEARKNKGYANPYNQFLETKSEIEKAMIDFQKTIQNAGFGEDQISQYLKNINQQNGNVEKEINEIIRSAKAEERHKEYAKQFMDTLNKPFEKNKAVIYSDNKPKKNEDKIKNEALSKEDLDYFKTKGYITEQIVDGRIVYKTNFANSRDTMGGKFREKIKAMEEKAKETELTFRENILLSNYKKEIELIEKVFAKENKIGKPDMSTTVRRQEEKNDEKYFTELNEKELQKKADLDAILDSLKNIEISSDQYAEKLNYEIQNMQLELKQMFAKMNQILDKIIKSEEGDKKYALYDESTENPNYQKELLKTELENIQFKIKEFYLDMKEKIEEYKEYAVEQGDEEKVKQAESLLNQLNQLKASVPKNEGDYYKKAKFELTSGKKIKNIKDDMKELIKPGKPVEDLKAKASELEKLLEEALNLGDKEAVLSILMVINELDGLLEGKSIGIKDLFDFLNVEEGVEYEKIPDGEELPETYYTKDGNYYRLKATSVGLKKPGLVGDLVDFIKTINKDSMNDAELAQYIPKISGLYERMHYDLEQNYNEQLETSFSQLIDQLDDNKDVTQATEGWLKKLGSTGKDIEALNLAAKRAVMDDKEYIDFLETRKQQLVPLTEELTSEDTVKKGYEDESALRKVIKWGAMISGGVPIEDYERIKFGDRDLAVLMKNALSAASQTGREAVDAELRLLKNSEKIKDYFDTGGSLDGFDDFVSKNYEQLGYENNPFREATSNTFDSGFSTDTYKMMRDAQIATQTGLGDHIYEDIAKNVRRAALMEAANRLFGDMRSKDVARFNSLLAAKWNADAHDERIKQYADLNPGSPDYESDRIRLNYELGGVDPAYLKNLANNNVVALQQAMNYLQPPQLESRLKLLAKFKLAELEQKKHAYTAGRDETQAKTDVTQQAVVQIRKAGVWLGLRQNEGYNFIDERTRIVNNLNRDIINTQTQIDALTKLIDSDFKSENLDAYDKGLLEEMNILDKDGNLGKKKSIGQDEYGEEQFEYESILLGKTVQVEQLEESAIFGMKLDDAFSFVGEIGKVMVVGFATGGTIGIIANIGKAINWINKAVTIIKATRLGRAGLKAIGILAESAGFTIGMRAINLLTGTKNEMSWADEFKHNIGMFAVMKSTMGTMMKYAGKIGKGMTTNKIGQKIIGSILAFGGEVGIFTAYSTIPDPNVWEQANKGNWDAVWDTVGTNIVENAKFIAGMKAAHGAGTLVKSKGDLQTLKNPEVKRRSSRLDEVRNRLSENNKQRLGELRQQMSNPAERIQTRNERIAKLKENLQKLKESGATEKQVQSAEQKIKDIERTNQADLATVNKLNREITKLELQNADIALKTFETNFRNFMNGKNGPMLKESAKGEWIKLRSEKAAALENYFQTLTPKQMSQAMGTILKNAYEKGQLNDLIKDAPENVKQNIAKGNFDNLPASTATQLLGKILKARRIILNEGMKQNKAEISKIDKQIEEIKRDPAQAGTKNAEAKIKELQNERSKLVTEQYKLTEAKKTALENMNKLLDQKAEQLKEQQKKTEGKEAENINRELAEIENVKLRNLKETYEIEKARLKFEMERIDAEYVESISDPLRQEKLRERAEQLKERMNEIEVFEKIIDAQLNLQKAKKIPETPEQLRERDALSEALKSKDMTPEQANKVIDEMRKLESEGKTKEQALSEALAKELSSADIIFKDVVTKYENYLKERGKEASPESRKDQLIREIENAGFTKEQAKSAVERLIEKGEKINSESLSRELGKELSTEALGKAKEKIESLKKETTEIKESVSEVNKLIDNLKNKGVDTKEMKNSLEKLDLDKITKEMTEKGIKEVTDKVINEVNKLKELIKSYEGKTKLEKLDITKLENSLKTIKETIEAKEKVEVKKETPAEVKEKSTTEQRLKDLGKSEFTLGRKKITVEEFMKDKEANKKKLETDFGEGKESAKALDKAIKEYEALQKKVLEAKEQVKDAAVKEFESISLEKTKTEQIKLQKEVTKAKEKNKDKTVDEINAELSTKTGAEKTALEELRTEKTKEAEKLIERGEKADLENAKKMLGEKAFNEMNKPRENIRNEFKDKKVDDIETKLKEYDFDKLEKSNSRVEFNELSKLKAEKEARADKILEKQKPSKKELAEAKELLGEELYNKKVQRIERQKNAEKATREEAKKLLNEKEFKDLSSKEKKLIIDQLSQGESAAFFYKEGTINKNNLRKAVEGFKERIKQEKAGKTLEEIARNEVKKLKESNQDLKLSDLEKVVDVSIKDGRIEFVEKGSETYNRKAEVKKNEGKDKKINKEDVQGAKEGVAEYAQLNGKYHALKVDGKWGIYEAKLKNGKVTYEKPTGTDARTAPEIVYKVSMEKAYKEGVNLPKEIVDLINNGAKRLIELSKGKVVPEFKQTLWDLAGSTHKNILIQAVMGEGKSVVGIPLESIKLLEQGKKAIMLTPEKSKSIDLQKDILENFGKNAKLFSEGDLKVLDSQNPKARAEAAKKLFNELNKAEMIATDPNALQSLLMKMAHEKNVNVLKELNKVVKLLTKDNLIIDEIQKIAQSTGLQLTLKSGKVSVSKIAGIDGKIVAEQAIKVVDWMKENNGFKESPDFAENKKPAEQALMTNKELADYHRKKAKEAKTNDAKEINEKAAREYDNKPANEPSGRYKDKFLEQFAEKILGDKKLAKEMMEAESLLEFAQTKKLTPEQKAAIEVLGRIKDVIRMKENVDFGIQGESIRPYLKSDNRIGPESMSFGDPVMEMLLYKMTGKAKTAKQLGEITVSTESMHLSPMDIMFAAGKANKKIWTATPGKAAALLKLMNVNTIKSQATISKYFNLGKAEFQKILNDAGVPKELQKQIFDLDLYQAQPTKPMTIEPVKKGNAIDNLKDVQLEGKAVEHQVLTFDSISYAKESAHFKNNLNKKVGNFDNVVVSDPVTGKAKAYEWNAQQKKYVEIKGERAIELFGKDAVNKQGEVDVRKVLVEAKGKTLILNNKIEGIDIKPPKGDGGTKKVAFRTVIDKTALSVDTALTEVLQAIGRGRGYTTDGKGQYVDIIFKGDLKLNKGETLQGALVKELIKAEMRTYQKTTYDTLSNSIKSMINSKLSKAKEIVLDKFEKGKITEAQANKLLEKLTDSIVEIQQNMRKGETKIMEEMAITGEQRLANEIKSAEKIVSEVLEKNFKDPAQRKELGIENMRTGKESLKLKEEAKGSDRSITEIMEGTGNMWDGFRELIGEKFSAKEIPEVMLGKGREMQVERMVEKVLEKTKAPVAEKPTKITTEGKVTYDKNTRQLKRGEAEPVSMDKATARDFNEFRRTSTDKQEIIPAMQARYRNPVVVRSVNDKGEYEYHQLAWLDGDNYALQNAQGKPVAMISANQLDNYDVFSDIKSIDSAIEMSELGFQDMPTGFQQILNERRNVLLSENMKVIDENNQRADDLLVLAEMSEVREEKEEKLKEIVFSVEESSEAFEESGLLTEEGYIKTEETKGIEPQILAYVESNIAYMEATENYKGNKENKGKFNKLREATQKIKEGLKEGDNTKITENVNKVLSIAEEAKENKDMDMLRLAKATLSNTGREQDKQKAEEIDSMIEEQKVPVESKIGNRIKIEVDMNVLDNVLEIGRTEEEKKDKMFEIFNKKLCST